MRARLIDTIYWIIRDTFVPSPFPAPCSHTGALIETCCWKIAVVGSGFSCTWFEDV